MKPFEQATVLFRLAEALKERGGWAGETHIQKTTYFLQELVGVPTGFEFILYKHGPFSFDLRATLTFMEAEDLIEWRPRKPYGPSLIKGRDASYLEQRFGEVSARYSKQIDFIAEHLAGKSVKELEKLATALFVTKNGTNLQSERAQQIVSLKPHISYSDAKAALEVVDGLIPYLDQISVG